MVLPAGLFLITLESDPAQVKVEKEVPVHAEFFRPPSKGPALVMITSSLRLGRLEHPNLTVALPIVPDYTGQKLVSLEVLCDQPGAMARWMISEDATTHSRYLQVSLGQARDGVTVSCKMFAVAPGETVTRTQDKDFKRWLGKTLLDSDLQSYSLGLKTPSAIVKWVAKDENSPIGNNVKWLGKDGEYRRALMCTSLLRMHRFSARVAQVVLTWPMGRECCAWMTEYVDEDGIWQMADPTIGISKLPRNSYFVISTPEVSTMIDVKLPNPIAEHFSQRALTTFPARGGSRLMVAAASREDQVLESAKQGQSLFFPENDLNGAAQKGVTNLSLFLLGLPTLPTALKH